MEFREINSWTGKMTSITDVVTYEKTCRKNTLDKWVKVQVQGKISNSTAIVMTLPKNHHPPLVKGNAALLSGRIPSSPSAFHEGGIV